MDVAMSISSAMQELCDQRPQITRMETDEGGDARGPGYDGTDSTH